MIDEPAVVLLAVARPVADPTVAMAGVPELQAAPVVVTSMDGPKLKVAIAVNCWVVPTGIEAVAGITASDTNVAVFTVKVAEADRPPKVAVMTDVPGATPTARPDVGLTVAMARVPEVQLEDAVTSLVDPSLYVTVAVNCWAVPTGIEAVAGVTAIDSSWADFQCSVTSPPPPPHPVVKKPLRININKR
jgi:hypothetical protein